MKKRKKIDEKRLTIKLILCISYLMIITILLVCSYKLYKENQEIKPWEEVDSVDEYTYMTIYKMSEKFAYYKEADVGIHFIIEKETTGQWHTYLIAIKEKDYDKYKEIIDYTYERIEKQPEPIKVYGYPVNIDKELKELAIKNIENFVPASNEIKITDENYETYLTNSYLDTTKEQVNKVDSIYLITLILLTIVIILFIMTIFDKDKIVDNIEVKMVKKTSKKRK